MTRFTTACLLNICLLSLAATLPAAELKEEIPPTLEELQKAPTAVTVGEVELGVSGMLIRNRMPTIGPTRGTRNYIIIRVKTKDGAALPDDRLEFTDVYAIQGETLWKAEKIEGPRGGRPGTVELVVRNAPEFGGLDTTAVILQMATGDGKKQRLRGAVKSMEVH
jgi:hypothetical protein